MQNIKKISVFCGSSTGNDAEFLQACHQLAALFVSHKTSLVYGGGNIGLMGILADEVLRLGGEVIGIIPQKLVDIEVAHTGLSRLFIVSSMHQRKAKMMELSDAFIIMPGGIGTLDEFFDVFTWKQLGYHNKPVSILNIKQFFDPLISYLNDLVGHGFVKQSIMDTLIIGDTPGVLMEELFDSL